MVADLGSVALVFEIREVVHLVDQPPCYHFVGNSGMWAAAGFGDGEEAGFPGPGPGCPVPAGSVAVARGTTFFFFFRAGFGTASGHWLWRRV